MIIFGDRDENVMIWHQIERIYSLTFLTIWIFPLNDPKFSAIYTLEIIYQQKSQIFFMSILFTVFLVKLWIKLLRVQVMASRHSKLHKFWSSKTLFIKPKTLAFYIKETCELIPSCVIFPKNKNELTKIIWFST